MKFTTRLAAFVASTVFLAASAVAQHAKGPDPTRDTLERTGPFATATLDVPVRSDFGGGRVWYPTAPGRYGIVAVAPGYIATASTMYFWGERLSSHGFVVIVIETSSVIDAPDRRARQLVAALDHLVTLGNQSGSGLYKRVDRHRRAVAGHSMGGGGALIAAANHPSLKAVIPMAPWNGPLTAAGPVSVPTLVLACEADLVAPTSQHARPFYNAIAADVPKAYVEVRADDHLCVMNGGGHDATLGRIGVAWLKRFVDNDLRYAPMLCEGANVTANDLSVVRGNCPH